MRMARSSLTRESRLRYVSGLGVPQDWLDQHTLPDSLCDCWLSNLEICRSLADVMARRMVLSEVIRLVGQARLPVDSELALLDSVADPVEPHVHCLGAFCLDCVVGDAAGRGVVCLDWSRAFLFPSHLL